MERTIFFMEFSMNVLKSKKTLTIKTLKNVAAIKNVKKRLLFAVMDALVDLKSESVKKTRTENLIPNTSNIQDVPSRRHVGLQQRSLSLVTCHCSSRSDHKRGWYSVVNCSGLSAGNVRRV